MQRTSGSVVTNPTDVSTIQLMRLGGLRGHSRRGVGKIVRTRGTRIRCDISSPRYVREATFRKSHQHGCLSKTWTRTAQIDILIHERRKSYQTSTLGNELKATKECWEQGRAQELVFQYQEIFHKQHYVDYENCVYIFKRVCVCKTRVKEIENLRQTKTRCPGRVGGRKWKEENDIILS